MVGTRPMSETEQPDLTSLPTCESGCFLLPPAPLRDTFCTMQPRQDSRVHGHSVGQGGRTDKQIFDIRRRRTQNRLLAKINGHEHWMSFKANREGEREREGPPEHKYSLCPSLPPSLSFCHSIISYIRKCLPYTFLSVPFVLTIVNCAWRLAFALGESWAGPANRLIQERIQPATHPHPL